MHILLYLFAGGLIAGQLASIVVDGGARISLLDGAVALSVIALIFSTPAVFLKKYVHIVGPFVLVALTSLIFSLASFTLTQIFIASLFLVRWVCYSSLLIIAWKLQKKVSIPKIMVSSTTMIALIGLMQYFLYPNLRNLAYLGWDPHEFRLFSTLLDPNFAGIILLIGLIMGAYLFLKHPAYKLLLGSVEVVQLVALLLTYSRGVYLSLLVTILIAMVYSRKWLLTLGLLLLLGVGIFLLPHPAGEGVNLLRTISIGSRLQDTQEGWRLFISAPLFGHGFDTIAYLKNQKEQSPGVVVPSSRAGFHNGYIQLLVMTGVLGFVSWMYMLYRLYTLKSKNVLLRKFVLLATMAVLVHSLFDNSILFAPILCMLWLLWGSATEYT